MSNATDVIQKVRSDLKLTQSAVAAAAGMDQSKFSRIEKGEVSSESDVKKILAALVNLGSLEAQEYIDFTQYDWAHIQPPSFGNPQRSTLLQIEETLGQVQVFLDDPNYPWPLKKQVENHKLNLQQYASYLTKLEHNIAVIGDIGVGKSTAISYVFELLKVNSKSGSITDNPILETGAGGTTICEVHIKDGPEFGLTLNPMPNSELKALVADFSSAKWSALNAETTKSKGEIVGVSREAERAIRNMSKLARKKVIVDGKPTYQDPVRTLVNESLSEDDFRMKVIELMNLTERDKNEIWYDSSTRQSPMEWLADVFKKINNGRMSECPLPSRINLLIPDFNAFSSDLSLTVIDTKGVDDLAVREDLDTRLRDSRTATVFCCRFNDAPGTSAKALLQHIRETSSDKIDDGKVLVLALPRDGEAIAMKDDLGDLAETVEEGYEFKRMQLEAEFATEYMDNIPVEFINVGSDNAQLVRQKVIGQVAKLRASVANKALDNCDTALEIINNHEAVALSAAVEEVSSKLANFIQGTPSLSTRERHAHKELIDTINNIRYASTLWAATRRNGVYSGLNALHIIGIGASKDAKKRADFWYAKLDAFLASLENDEALQIASKAISSIRSKAIESKMEFTERARSIAIETYDEPLSHSHVWYQCASEWGRGSGFKVKVVGHLNDWFDEKVELQETLEASILANFKQSVIQSLLNLTTNTN